MISIVACCHDAKLCADAAWDFRSQRYLSLRWTSKRRVRYIILSLEVGLFVAVHSYAW